MIGSEILPVSIDSADHNFRAVPTDQLLHIEPQPEVEVVGISLSQAFSSTHVGCHVGFITSKKCHPIIHQSFAFTSPISQYSISIKPRCPRIFPRRLDGGRRGSLRGNRALPLLPLQRGGLRGRLSKQRCARTREKDNGTDRRNRYFGLCREKSHKTSKTRFYCGGIASGHGYDFDVFIKDGYGVFTP